ncbi:MAG: AzlD domain-containing protein [Acidimicrobiales bacterium]|nr:AzlD domain-containing protein [Acidimicrobiales bacterium]
MSPLGLALFLGGVFGLRMLGGFALGGLLAGNDRATRLLVLMPLSIVAAVIAVQTFTVKADVVIDARVVGIAVAAVLSWRKVPMGVVVVIAAATTALVRLTGWG